MNSSTESVTRRKFNAAPNIIYSLIHAQAGTLGKAILECVMNSIDAGASRVEVKLTPSSLVIADNGKGFSTMSEIEECFDVFGFEHQEGDRKYGQFGIGRAQLWNFCRTVWRTHEFQMDVDIKGKGLDYDLTAGLPFAKGLRIDGTLYETLSGRDLMACENEIKELCAYAPAEVIFNGNRISTEPTTEKWTHETEDAWIRLTNDRALTVYNMGVYVRSYSSYHFGTGGIVVTKPNVRLALNMARNDILMSQCKVWKRLRPYLQTEADKKTQKSSKLSDSQARNLVSRYLCGDLSWDDVASLRLLQTVTGQTITLRDLSYTAYRRNATVIVAPQGADNRAEHLARIKAALVLTAESAERFNGATSAKEIKDALDQRAQQEDGGDYKLRAISSVKWLDEAETLQLLDTVKQGYKQIPASDLTAIEKWARSEIDKLQGYVVSAVGTCCPEVKYRTFNIGESDSALAWTDAKTQVTADRTFIKECLSDKLPGFMRLAHVLVHEYLHTESTASSHSHGEIGRAHV